MSVPASRLLLTAGGESWESLLLPLLAGPGALASLGRRCVDVPDLVAAAAAGQGTVAVVSADLDGLDSDVVARVQAAGVRVVAVAADDVAQARAARLDVDRVVAGPEPDVVLDAVATLAALPADPTPAVPRTEHWTDQAAARGAGQVVAVWGPTGAPGRSTVALGLSAAAAAAGVQTVLVDADVYGGASAQMLAVLDEVSGVLAAARAASTGALDDVALAEAARQVAPRLRVLTGLPRADRWTALRPAAVRTVLSRCRRAARLVVVDCGFSLEQDEELSYDTAAPRRNGATLTALEAADRVLVVGTADPLGVARLARARLELREVAPAAAVRLVVNRVRAGLGWSRDDVSQTLLRVIGEVPLAYLPLDQSAVDSCWSRGAALTEAASQAPLTKAIAELAEKVAADLGIGPLPAAGRHNNRTRSGARSAVRS